MYKKLFLTIPIIKIIGNPKNVSGKGNVKCVNVNHFEYFC